MPNNNNNDNKVHRAGTIPYYVDDSGTIQMLFMKPSNTSMGGNSFQCPKGKIEEGESTIAAALRESQEEVGLFMGNIVGVVKELGVFLGRTTMFIAEIADPDMFGLPQDETGSTSWMSPEQFDKTGRTLHRPIVKSAVRAIKRRHMIDE